MAAIAEATKYRVRLRQSLAGPGISSEKGDTVEVTAIDGHRMVHRGIAEEIDPDKPVLPKLSKEDEKRVRMKDVATVRAKGNSAKVEPLEDRLAREAAERVKKRNHPVPEEDEDE